MNPVASTDTSSTGSGNTCGLPKRILTLAASALALTLTSCGISGLSFVQDERVDIVRPKERSEVRVPVTIEWTVKDFEVGPGAGSFGVFVDRAPTRSGQTLAWLFRGDDTCKGDDGKKLCATPDFLTQRNVFQTTDTEFTIQLIPKLTGNEKRRQFHEATIVLLDEDGRRVGEGAWSVQFEVKDAN